MTYPFERGWSRSGYGRELYWQRTNETKSKGQTATLSSNSLSDRTVPYGILAVLWLVGWTLRVPILAALPLATRISESLKLGSAAEGALTMLPIVALALGAIPAAWMIGRIWLRAAIVVGLLVMAAASVARGQVPSASFLLTLVGGWFADSLGRIEIALLPALVFMIAALGALGKKERYQTYE